MTNEEIKNKKLEALMRVQSFLETANKDYATTKEVALIVSDIIKELKIIKGEISSTKNVFTQDLDKLFNNLKSISQKDDYSADFLSKEISNLKSVFSSLKLKNGKDGKDGVSPDPTIVAKIALETIKTEIPTIDTIVENIPVIGEKVRDSLEILQGEERLDAKAIKNLPEFTTKIIKNTQGGVLGIKGITAGTGIVVDTTNLQYPKVSTLTPYLPLTGGTMTGNITLGENTSIDLDPAGSADGKYTGITITGTGGATIAFGRMVYLKAADSQWYETDADAIATSGVMVGMTVTTTTDNNPVTILLMGQIRADASFPALTVGAPVYIGETVGDIQVAIPTGADAVIRCVGFALTADEIYFNPSQDNQTVVA